MGISVIICAAGKGQRAGFSKNKLLMPFGACTVLEHTLQSFMRKDINQIIVAVAPCDKKEISSLCKPFSCQIVEGGETRTQSVKNALSFVKEEIVLIHDGARTFVTKKIIDDCIESTKLYGSGICALPISDTVAFTGGQAICSFPPRENIFTIQTPQGFKTQAIQRAYAQIETQLFTDDSSVYATFIAPPHFFIGNRCNKKLTFSEDFNLPSRTGIGKDTHAFACNGKEITLCGIKIPSEKSLLAHSDGDVAIHALMDALLSASGLRDIGYYFPDTSDTYKNADSMELLKQVLLMLKEKGLFPCNVSIAIQAETPKLAPYIVAMQKRVSEALFLPVDAVGISAGTNEGLGYIGEKKGISVTAMVLLKTLGE